MTMDQEKQPHTYHSAEESPIPVPPVEEGWSMMKQQLDIHQPVTGRWAFRWTSRWATRLGRPALWMVAAAVMVTGILVFWPHSHHRIGKASPGATAATSQPRAADSAGATQNYSTGDGITDTHQTNTNDAHPITSAGTYPNNTTSKRPTTGAHSTPVHANPNHTNPNQETAYNQESNHNRSTNHNLRTSHNLRPNHYRTHYTAGSDLHNHTSGYDPHNTRGRDLTSHTTNHTNHTKPTTDHTQTPGSTLRWTTYPTKLAGTNPPAPKFIPAADSLLRAIHASNKTATAAPKKKNQQTGLALAAGLSLSQSIPIGQQQLSSYRLLSDYIPSPYLRLYMGDRWYLQTTPHLLSAQYTPSQLIDSSGGDTSRIQGYPQYLQYNKVTLKKLYYTDIPLTINYRVFKGLYLGAGIQYSRLWQAAAEDRITLHPSNGFGSDTLISSKIISLKNNDSAFSKLARSDWRLLLEADYVWRRFTFGLQYQRGLNSYLPVNPSGTKGTDKNSSFSIHIYYEIWNQRRRNN